MWVYNQQQLCSLSEERQPTVSIAVPCCSPQSNWSPIFRKMLFASVPVLSLTLSLPDSKAGATVTNNNQAE